jgi:hypothetical protein
VSSSTRILSPSARCAPPPSSRRLRGCSKQVDPIDASEKAGKSQGVAVLGVADTQAIAEEAFVYGLPIVMNYAVMNEFVVDRNSGQ